MKERFTRFKDTGRMLSYLMGRLDSMGYYEVADKVEEALHCDPFTARVKLFAAAADLPHSELGVLLEVAASIIPRSDSWDVPH